MYKQELAERIALSYLGTPYYWGGDDPIQGFDCSGFVIEILKSVGILERSGDWTAAGLFNLFDAHEVVDPTTGCLVFWANRDDKIIHVEYCLDSTLSIGASGGGSTTTTVEEAIRRNALVKIRPFHSRSGIAGFVNPWS